MRAQYFIALFFVTASTLIYGEPSSAQIARDAADFHHFRVAVLAAATEVAKEHPNSNAGAEYIGAECRKLAARTTPDYLFGVFADLAADTSRTEEPYLIGECLVMAYPPEAAKKVLREIKNIKGYNPDEIQAWIEDVESAQKHQWN